MPAAPRSDPAFMGGAEQGDHRRAHGQRGMQRKTVAGDHDPGPAQQRAKLKQGKFAGQTVDAFQGAAGERALQTPAVRRRTGQQAANPRFKARFQFIAQLQICLLYTSDAADE